MDHAAQQPAEMISETPTSQPQASIPTVLQPAILSKSSNSTCNITTCTPNTPLPSASTILAKALKPVHPEAPPGKWQKQGEAIADPYPSTDVPPMDKALYYGMRSAPWRKSEGGTGLPAATHRSNHSQPAQRSELNINNGSSGSTCPPEFVPKLPKHYDEQPWNKFSAKCGLHPQNRLLPFQNMVQF